MNEHGAGLPHADDRIELDLLASVDPLELTSALWQLTRPSAAAEELPGLLAELARIALGRSELDRPDGDPRFADPAWRDNPVYRRLGQTYRLWERTVYRLVEQIEDGDWTRRERARYLANILTGALAPTNTVLGNPAAVRRAARTGGGSVLRGLRNLARDLVSNGGLPRMVDTRPFTVGRNLACTPGVVVYREEMFELLRYRPVTPLVRCRPLVVIPPQINRYYVLDLAPGRSLVEHVVSHGVQTFMVVWRNPRPEHGHWGLDAYLAAMLRAAGVVRALTDSADVNWLGLCAGGATSALLLGHLAATGTSPIHSATFLVTMLDSRRPNMVGTMATARVRRVLARDAAEGKVYSGEAVARSFAWMRPNDLIFHYLVRNWLLGDDPPAFDILAWNDDSARVTAAFERDLVEVLASDKATRPGAVTVLGSSVNLSRVRIDTFHVAGLRDHLTTWRPCYLASQLLGGNREMVVADTGHIQTFVNPPGSRHRYWAGPSTEADPDVWLAGASAHHGSWWPKWTRWLLARSGAEQPAPTELGSERYPAGDPAPGRYVHEG